LIARGEGLRFLLRISRIIDSITEWFGRATFGLVVVMVLVGVWNVFGRYLGKLIGFNLTSNALIEIQWYLFDLIFLLGAAYVLKHNDHVRVDLFYKDWTPRGKALVNFIGALFFVLPFCGLLIYYSWGNILNSWQILEISPDPGGLPRYPIKSAIIVSLLLLILQGISEAIKNWFVLKSSDSQNSDSATGGQL